jgi:spermidine/putrescine transport system substrate-binding protein
MLQKKSLAVLGFSLVFLGACTPKSPQSEPKSEERVLRVLTWTEYLEEDTVTNFEKSTGIKVSRDYFTSNEELLAKIQFSVQSGKSGYDLILPSDYMVSTMVRQNLLKPIDHKKLAVFSKFSKDFLSPAYDSKLQHAVPLAWGSTGVVVNTKLIPALKGVKKISWKDILENPKYKGRVTLLDDAKENLHVALMIQGKAWATATEDDIKAAFAYLKKVQGQIKIFTPEAEPAIEAGDCGLCMVYSGTGIRMAAGNPDLVYLIPSEGATIWTDNFAIPSNAAHSDWAEQFIDAVLADQSAAAFTNRTYFPTANVESYKLLKESTRTNVQVFPDAAIFKTLNYLTDREELLQLTDRLWTEFKSL